MTLRLTEKQVAKLGIDIPDKKRVYPPKNVTCTCGKPFIAKTRKAIYCPECCHERKKAQARAYVAKNYVAHARGRHLSDPLILNDAERSGLAWYDIDPPSLLWRIALAIPYSGAMSKNKRLGRTRDSTYLRKEARAAQDTIIEYFAAAIHQHQQTIVTAKLWIDVFVQKPNHYGDAVNFVDTVCDALKVATGLDDRWYSIRRLDWEIVLDDPHVFIGIGQDTDEPHGICSLCKRMLPKTMFRVSKSRAAQPNVTGGVCVECRIPSKKS